MRKILLQEKGMALLITLMIVSILIVVTVQLGHSMHRQLVSSANCKDDIMLDAMTRSGMNLAMELMEMDKKIPQSDTYHIPLWEKISGQDLSSLFEQGTLKLTVSDLSGRFEINSLVAPKTTGGVDAATAGGVDATAAGGVDAATAKKSRQLLKRLLLSGNFAVLGENDAQEIIDALVEWMSPDDAKPDSETQDSFYGTAEHPYGCKHGPVTTVAELLLVRGIRPELLYGDAEHAALAPFLTAQGNDGKININTADPLLLQAIDAQMTPELAQDMADYRNSNPESLLSITWYKKLPSWPIDVSLDTQLITTQSNYLMITAIGSQGNLTRKRVAIVHCGQGGQKTSPISINVE
jgi:general secretion pathway protein K